MGRIVRKLIKLTSEPKYIDETMIFLPNRFAWVDFVKTDRQKLSSSTFKIVNKAIGVSGLRSMDELLTNIIAQSLRECVAGAIVAKTLTRVGEGVRDYRLPNLDEAFVKNFCKDLHGIGACLLLRTFVNTELSSSAKIDSGNLVKAIENVNDAMLCDETQHVLSAKLLPSQSRFYEELSDKLKSIGSQTPLLQTYVKIDESDAQKINVADVLFVFLEKYVFPNVEYSEELKILIASEVSGRSLFRYDVSAIIVGIASLCAQFNGTETLTQHIASVGLEIKSRIAAIAMKRREDKLSKYANVKPPKPGGSIVSTRKNIAQGNLERTYSYPDDVRKLVAYLETLSYFANVDREVLERFVPSYVLHNAHSYVDLSY
jgi:hypothetical protein